MNIYFKGMLCDGISISYITVSRANPVYIILNQCYRINEIVLLYTISNWRNRMLRYGGGAPHVWHIRIWSAIFIFTVILQSFTLDSKEILHKHNTKNYIWFNDIYLDIDTINCALTSCIADISMKKWDKWPSFINKYLMYMWSYVMWY